MASETVELKAPNGTSFFVTLEGNDLWVRVERDEGSASLEWEPNAMNEGWLVQKVREPIAHTQIPDRPSRTRGHTA